ncbi:adenylate/guanylate cyclase domain-containing protein [Limnospira sp. PMC 1042.18]|uniref:adenylate/guanylate cyclase domain-containing protein n=1 Tax=Limnospira sp. PMC 1042.18 TaxID=2981018 RepID=UPI0028E16584|nr:adenylate/guanylate cyclase domain-containing protein [Limnospira sp. PMC 1042.18]MDT9199143.1 adenylate/guanylate cyclase domain-containing protein [Limnospira sp. PMC 1042.18]
MNANPDLVLIVDDNEINRDLLARRLQKQGYDVLVASNGFEALKIMRSTALDLVLLDIMMPQMNGYQVLESLKADLQLRHIPVIMISAVNDIDSIVRCIELGAEDYLSKPFNHVLLRARINACLEKKRLRDQEQAYLQKLAAEQQKSERLLLNILPAPIAQRLKQGESTIADSFADVTVLFADIVNFTKLSDNLSPAELVEILNQIFSAFDQLAENYGLEKIKTIGDAYMVVGGLPTPRPDHAEAIADMALEMQKIVTNFSLKPGETLTMRMGINTGPVEAGVIGTRKFAYDLWGDTVNTANRMESHGLAGKIQVTETTYQRLRHGYEFQPRGIIDVKGKGEMNTYFLIMKKP